MYFLTRAFLFFLFFWCAQFPQACTTQEALDDRICCPLWNGSPCGSRFNRGTCAPHSPQPLPKSKDYREHWPSVFYDTVCTCYGNYDGFDCGQCSPGWTGPTCTQRHHVLRKEITDMTESERVNFFESLQKAKTTTSSRYKILISNDTTVKDNYEFHHATVYDLYVWLHYYAAKSFYGTHNNAAHMGPAFPFWHRVFLLFIEREIRDLTGNQDFYIPYWDWTRNPYCNICINRYFGASNQDGTINRVSHFSRWRVRYLKGNIICTPTTDESVHVLRQPGTDPLFNTLPTIQDVIETLEMGTYDTSPYDRTATNSFRNKLEGFEITHASPQLRSSMHNLVHNYLNGTVSDVPIAANDPIFMVHHSFIDKLLEVWLRSHTNASYPESNEVFPPQRAHSNMAPFFPLRTNAYYWDRTTELLGYSYLNHSKFHFSNATDSLRLLEAAVTAAISFCCLNLCAADECVIIKFLD
uniref:Tyrosinase copper-binding domain-containing protein n=1 Tax=Sphaeramia orbicularis TaxID=375764 RepID=A0A673AFK8_9TELE